MSARVWWRDEHTGTAEITDHIRTDSWTLTESAEEGSVGAATLVADDADGTFGALTMLGSHIEVIDSDSAGDSVVWAGHIGEQTLSRGDTVLSAQWSNSTMDRNYGWARRALTGTASNRPAETDTQRVAWLLATSEASADLDDVTTYVSAAAGTPMDACDYRGQTVDQVMSDCSTASGRNWWAQEMGAVPGTATGTAYWAGVKTYAWYDLDTSAAYGGTCVITNDASLVDLATYWPPSQDAEMYRDFSGVYSGALGNWDGGSTYRFRAATASAYGRRDTVVPLPNVKSAATAAKVLDRMLESMAEPHVRVRVGLEVPASVVNQFKPGMRVVGKFTHFTSGLDGLAWYRVLNREVSQAAAGERYRLRLEMTPVAVPAPEFYGYIAMDLYNSEDAGRTDGAAYTYTAHLSALWQCSAGDYFELYTIAPTLPGHSNTTSISPYPPRMTIANTSTLSGARVRATAAQVQGNGNGDMAIAFGAADYDTGPYWSAAQPSRLTVPASGTYLVSAEVAGLDYTALSAIRITAAA